MKRLRRKNQTKAGMNVEVRPIGASRRKSKSVFRSVLANLKGPVNLVLRLVQNIFY